MATQVHVLGIYDEVGRYLGPAEVAIQMRPEGPWDSNTANVPELIRICAWCPDFDRSAPVNVNATHGICPSCLVKIEAGWAA